jgi:AcrR family transcriptional regulator
MARPRSDEARRKVLDAARDLIVERGVASLSIEEVAARSGVAKTTIYRHWPGRASLIIDTFNAQFEHIGIPDTGSLRRDLEAFFGAAMRADLSGNVARLMPSLIDAANRDPEMSVLLDRIGADRERVCATIVERARQRGELHPDFADLDTEQLVGVIVGPIVFQKLVRRRTLTPAYVNAVLDVVLGSLAPQPAMATPRTAIE